MWGRGDLVFLYLCSILQKIAFTIADLIYFFIISYKTGFGHDNIEMLILTVNSPRLFWQVTFRIA